MRDQPGGARAVAYLMLAGGVYNFVTGVLMKLGEPLIELVTLGVTSTVLFALGLVCLRRPGVLPALFWPLVPFVSAGVITGLNVATADATLGPQLFYLWPLLYASSFLSRRLIVAVVVQISAGHALTAFRFEPADRALRDWIAITVAMSMTAVVVAGLRERNDRLLRVLEDQATSDALTGVANRRAFDTALAEAIGAEHVALVVIDVDHFKTINDTWGHAIGDRALCAVADALRDALPDAVPGHGHMVARLGGDEFAVLLRSGPATALRYAETARARITAGGELPCGPPSLSIGIAAAPDHATTAEELQRVADGALYRSKAGGRGRSTLAGADEPRHNVDDVPVTSRTASRSGSRSEG